MADRLGTKLDLARDLSSMLLRSDAFRESLPVQASGGRVLLVASLEEPVEVLLRRVAEVGLPATVCVRSGKNSISMVSLDVAATSEAEIFVPRHDATLGVLVALLWRKRTLLVRAGGFDVPHVGDVDFALV